MNTTAPRFAIWYAEGAPRDEELLTQLLVGAEVGAARVYADQGEWLDSNATVFVLRGTDDAGMRGAFVSNHRIGPSGDVEESVELAPEFEPGLQLMRGRRILGFGYQAARTFGSWGLKMYGGSATFELPRGAIVALPGSLVARDWESTPLLAFDSQLLQDGQAAWTCQAMHLPRWGLLAQRVEAVARWADHPHYAPIVRDQNVVWSGIAADARTWTQAFRRLVHDIAWSLARRPLEPFSLPQWSVAEAGVYDLALAPCGDLDSPYRREFLFRFSHPVLFSAHLEIESGREIMLLFNAERSPLDGARVDSQTGEALDIQQPITSRSIAANKGRHWELDVTNFGSFAARCRLTLRFEESATIVMPGGLEVSLTSPPQDEETVSRVVDLLAHQDGTIQRNAESALTVIGTPALDLLRAAQKNERRREAQRRQASPLVPEAPEPRRKPLSLAMRIGRVMRKIQEQAAVG